MPRPPDVVPFLDAIGSLREGDIGGATRSALTDILFAAVPPMRVIPGAKPAAKAAGREVVSSISKLAQANRSLARMFPGIEKRVAQDTALLRRLGFNTEALGGLSGGLGVHVRNLFDTATTVRKLGKNAKPAQLMEQALAFARSEMLARKSISNLIRMKGAKVFEGAVLPGAPLALQRFLPAARAQVGRRQAQIRARREARRRANP